MIAPYRESRFQAPTKGEVKRAGEVLKLSDNASSDKYAQALKLVKAWRSLHMYPLNTFQALLRKKLKAIGVNSTSPAQRLKRMPTIINKLGRLPGTLDRMQDIGGIRIVFPDVVTLITFKEKMEASRFQHKLKGQKDYISIPKEDGYRGVHLIYQWFSSKAPEAMQGLNIELQLRSELQHFWATAVEAVDMFYGKSLKIGKREKDWSGFFLAASAAFALHEGTALPAQYRGFSSDQVKNKLISYAIKVKAVAAFEAMQKISSKFSLDEESGYYHILIFSPDEMESRVAHMSFAKKQQERAEQMYEQMESFFQGKSSDVVLVAADPKELKKLYLNYFLNVDGFLKALKHAMA